MQKLVTGQVGLQLGSLLCGWLLQGLEAAECMVSRGGSALNPFCLLQVALGTEQPMWRYIDPDGNMQASAGCAMRLRWHYGLH